MQLFKPDIFLSALLQKNEVKIHICQKIENIFILGFGIAFLPDDEKALA
jgi:hypothetical protein